MGVTERRSISKIKSNPQTTLNEDQGPAWMSSAGNSQTCVVKAERGLPAELGGGSRRPPVTQGGQPWLGGPHVSWKELTTEAWE